jgi:lipopolysaccharide heptosyltransferase II
MDQLKFLILRLSAVGDVIRTLPAVKALKEYYPNSSITWITEEPSRTLLESQPEIDKVLLLPRERWTYGMKSLRRMGRTMGEGYGFILDLRRRRFDVALDFHGIVKSGLLSFLSGAPQRIGFDRKSSKEGNFLFSNIKVRLPKERMSRFQKNFALLRGMGLEVNPVRNSNGSLNPAGIIVKSHLPAEQRGIISNGVNHFTPNLHVPEEDREHIESFFNTLSLPIKRPLIAIHPGTSPKTIYKRWMADQYSQLSDRLIHELNATVIFTWGPGELNWVEGIRKQMKEPSILGPQTESLTKLGEIFRRSNLYIGGDTGPMHIASLMGVPVVVIYGPTDPIVNEPFGPHKKVRKEVGCNPCRKRSCKELTCLKTIQVDDVFKASNEILRITT